MEDTQKTVYHINGFQLQQAVQRARLSRKIAQAAFKESLFKFEGDDAPKPAALMDEFRSDDIKLARLEELQQQYNLFVIVRVDHAPITLAKAIKQVGGAQRAVRLWREAAAEKDRGRGFHLSSLDLKRDNDAQYAKRQCTPQECGAHANQASIEVSKYKQAIAVGNSIQMEVDEDDYLLVTH